MSRLAKLVTVEKRLSGRTDDELRAEVDELRAELRTFRQEHRLFRERAHAAVEATVADARQAAEQSFAELAGFQGPAAIHRAPNGAWPPALQAATWTGFASPEFAKAWHAAVDRADGFSELTVAQFEKRCSEIEAEIRAIDTELERRRIILARDEADADLAALEAQLGLEA